MNDEMSTSEAALLLGLSRPCLIRLIERGEIPCRFVGPHRRLSIEQVVAYREMLQRRRNAMAA